MFTLIFTGPFDKSYKLIIKENTRIEAKIRKTLHFLEKDPFYPSLKTHKAITKSYGAKWSSWVDSDIRIIWDFDGDKRLIITFLDIGKHSGSKKVYK